MADGYWSRQPPAHSHSMPMAKRPRPDYGAPSGHEMLNYLPRDEDRGGPRMNGTMSIGSSYDRYLQNMHVPSFGPGDDSNFGGLGIARGGLSGIGIGDSLMMGGPGPVGPDRAQNGRTMGFGGPLSADRMARSAREMSPLPPDASNTIFVEGLPPDSTKREVAHIFRPFLGFKEVRLVNKEPKHRGGDPLLLCFVDFRDAACAATALSALQGYKMDEHDPDSHHIRLQFARFPGPRSGPSRGKR